MRPAPSHRRTLLVAATVGLAAGLGASAAPASAAPKHYIPRVLADISLNSSPWSKRNDAVGGCEGLGPMRRDINQTRLFATFRCKVDDGAGEPRGVVVVTTTGPESVRVSRVESGDLSGHVPIEGTRSKVKPRVLSFEAGPFVERSTWARGKELYGVLCFGVGRFKDSQAGYLFGSFVCRVRIIGSAPVIVLARAKGDRAVRVVRTLA